MRLNTTTAALIAASTFLLACEEEEKKTPITAEEATAFANEWAPGLETALLQRTEGASVGRELKAVIDAAATKEEAKGQREEPPYDVFVRDVYESLDYKPHAVVGGKLSPAGKAMWSNIQTVPEHALDAEPYHIAEITTAITELEKQAGDGHGSDDLAATDADKQWVVTYLSAMNKEDLDLTAEDAHDKVTEAFLASDAAKRLETALKEHEEFGDKLAKATANLEWMLSRDWVKFSRDVGNRHVRFQFVHPRHDDYYNDPEIRKQNERDTEARAAYKAGVMWRKAVEVAHANRKPTEILHNRIRASLKDVLTAEKPEEVAAAVWPSHPQYKKLLAVYKQYQDIVDAGGWKKVKEQKRLKEGSRGATVKALKERLKVEGYFTGKVDSRFDKDLKEAVIAYQRTHQMEVTGKPHRTFWRSLNVPAKRRLDQIVLNIKRWRYTNSDHANEETYVYVNIPDFTAELWDKGKREMRFEVVVGNNDLVEDEETGEKEHANRTPFPIAAFIDRAIYNPYWNVTPRVRTNEILPEVKEWVEASYLKKIEDEKKYEALRRALEGNSGSDSGSTTTNTGTTFASTNMQNTGATSTTTSATGDAKPDEPQGVTPQAKAIWAANPEKYPYYNAEIGEVDVSTTKPENIPGWYAANDYEVMHAGKKWEYVRMTPGEHNALGFVKVIFPNYHDVYLHDTNAKPLFKRDIRAFSHGCMRMSKPLEFAEYLLRRDGLYESNNIKTVLKDGTYLPVFLKRQVPVYVEYRTVRVDDEGRANFLADIYDADAEGIVVPKDTAHIKKTAAP